jgi:hypothetical protein
MTVGQVSCGGPCECAVLAVVSLAEGSVCELLARFPSQLGSTLVTATLYLRSQLRARQRWKLAMHKEHGKHKESGCLGVL